MKYKLVYYDEARQDIREAKSWYKNINAPLANRFSQTVKRTILSLQQGATTHAIRYKNIRIANTPVFPYAVHYYVDETNTYVIIIAIVHTSRHPDIARERS